MDPEASPLPTHPRPIRLLYNVDFCMDPEAMALLQLLKGPVAVVSECGRARQGKSFLLNQVFNEISSRELEKMNDSTSSKAY